MWSGFRNARQPRPILVTLCNVIPVLIGLQAVTKALIRAISGRHPSITSNNGLRIAEVTRFKSA